MRDSYKGFKHLWMDIWEKRLLGRTEYHLETWNSGAGEGLYQKSKHIANEVILALEDVLNE